MTLRPPSHSSSSTLSRAAASPVAALDYEIAQEQASALGRLGRALEAALAALEDHEAHHRERNAARAKLMQDAGHALWCFIVQREACGMHDPKPVLRAYRVPAEVHNRMGVFGGR
jgi:hypothetical protein